MEQFCLKCGLWRSQTDDKCKKEHSFYLKKKKGENNAIIRS